MYEYEVKEVVRVVDGDTIDVVFDLGFSLFKKERIRLAGIDTPETRTRDLEEKKLGLEAKEKVEEALTAAELIVCQTEKEGKYGRILGWLFLDGSAGSFNKQLIDEGFAWPYLGGQRTKDLNELKERRKDV
jgi:micrococcal nuclease|tara:strand:+ start:2502 stop:2894 length:393 start_codon:yes stop_codon:yes gene_type:complete